MPPFNFGEIKLAVDGDSSQARPVSETPFRILLLGDFSGTGPKKPLPSRKPVQVDRDNFDEVLAAFHPELQINLGDEETRNPAVLRSRRFPSRPSPRTRRNVSQAARDARAPG